MASPHPKDDHASLLALLTTTTDNLTAFLAQPAVPSTPLAAPPAPLPLLHDSATLLKAHATKLALLAITPPVTPSALGSVVRELAGSALPALQAAAEIADPPAYGRVLADEVRRAVGRCLREARAVLAEVRGIVEADRAAATSKDRPQSKGKAAAKPALTGTAMLFEAADALIALAAGGFVGLVVRKAEGYRAVLRDALEELKEWGEERAEDDDDDGGDGESDADSADEVLVFEAEKKLSEDDVEVRALLERALKKMRMADVLFQALVKRRLKTFPLGRLPVKREEGQMASVDRLDSIVETMAELPDAVDEMAEAFYEIDEGEVKASFETCCSRSLTLVELAHANWDDDDDEFTAWAKKWKEAFQA